MLKKKLSTRLLNLQKTKSVGLSKRLLDKRVDVTSVLLDKRVDVTSVGGLAMKIMKMRAMAKICKISSKRSPFLDIPIVKEVPVIVNLIGGAPAEIVGEEAGGD